jgi:hypothetical protein
VTITFNKEIYPDLPGTVTLNGAALSGGHWTDDRTYEIPYSGLLGNTSYTVGIAGFYDWNGEIMLPDSTHSFTTVESGGSGSGSRSRSGGGGSAPTNPKAPDAPAPKAAFPFDDVNDRHWFYDDVVWAWENGLLTGTDAANFSPFLNTTRAMLATLVYRLECEPAVTGTNTFTDVLDDYWYTDAITWAEANGVVKGYSETIFAPDKDITREELVTLLWRYAGSPAAGGGVPDAPFTDADTVSDYAKAAFAWAVSIGIVEGDDAGRLNPHNPASRAEVAALFRRYAEKVK